MADFAASDEEDYYSSDRDALDGIENDDEADRNWPSSSLPSCQVRVCRFPLSASSDDASNFQDFSSSHAFDLDLKADFFSIK